MAAPEGMIFIVDDDAEVRQSWECVLAAADLPVRGFPSAEAFLEEADCDRPSCVVLDLRMPGMGGMALLQTLRQVHPSLPIIVISGHADVPAVIQSMKLGAIDFLTKPVDPALFVAQMREVLRTAAAARVRMDDEKTVRNRIATLSTRELEVFRLLIKGKLHKQIARDLGISSRTVDHHHAQISAKMQAANLADLIRMGFFAGLT